MEVFTIVAVVVYVLVGFHPLNVRVGELENLENWVIQHLENCDSQGLAVSISSGSIYLPRIVWYIHADPSGSWVAIQD